MNLGSLLNIVNLDPQEDNWANKLISHSSRSYSRLRMMSDYQSTGKL